MMADPEIAKSIGDRFDHVLVDEYQDTNRLQSRILMALKPDGQGVMVVGDDAQAIYTFRAATIRNILKFPNQFSPSAQIIPLEQNYRSTQPILDAANAVIGFAQDRFTQNSFSERQSKQRPGLTTVVDEVAQARYVAEQILRAREEGFLSNRKRFFFEHLITAPSSKSNSPDETSRSLIRGPEVSRGRSRQRWD
jgi:DNA helicase-2/ATP-dependent DNA helicase PcrA